MQTTEITGPAWATHYTRRALAELPADITTATPPQVDELIRTARLDRDAHGSRLARLVDDLHAVLGHERRTERIGTGRHRETKSYWVNANGERLAHGSAVSTATEMDRTIPSRSYYSTARTVGEALSAIYAHLAVDAEIAETIQRGTDEFDRRGGWTRYYRVNNSNGHVHVRTSCKETYPTTQWTWPTHLSGATAAEVVEYAAALTCLTCFPSQRTAILDERPPRFEMFETREQTAERKAREAEKAARLADKIAKGITPDGSPLYVRIVRSWTDIDDPCEVKTERAAELRLVDALFEQAGAMPDERRERSEDAVVALVDALAWKRGRPAAEIREQVAPKVAKRVTRGY